jgi:ankyrin repeat protein
MNPLIYTIPLILFFNLTIQGKNPMKPSDENINQILENGKTILMVAVQSNDIERTKYLIEHGADTEARDNKNKRAID